MEIGQGEMQRLDKEAGKRGRERKIENMRGKERRVSRELCAPQRGGCPRLRFVGNARSITRRTSSAPSHPRRHHSKGHCPKRHGHPLNNPYPISFSYS